MKGTTKINSLFMKLLGSSLLVMITACSFRQPERIQGVGNPDWSDFRKAVLDRPDHSHFMKPGPYGVTKHLKYQISLNPGQEIDTDFYRSSNKGKAPLALIMHGNGYSKLAHRNQAEHLSSWGIHTLLVNLPNRDQWIKNGKTLKKLIQLIHAWPQILTHSIDADQIIVIGHSFGGSASMIASGRNSPVKGVILLDPAVVHQSIRKYMKRVQKPVLILGADQNVFRSKKRWQFFRYIPGPVAEFSITGATHNDAQSPGINKVRWGFDWETDEGIQKKFTAFITGGIFSISGTGRLEYAWSLYNLASKLGVVKKGRIRFVPSQKNERLGYKKLLRSGFR